MERDLTYYCDGTARHLVCVPYSNENLNLMAHDLGINRCWKHADPKHPHFDIPKKRVGEIMNKCRVVDTRTILSIIDGTFKEPPEMKQATLYGMQVYKSGYTTVSEYRELDPDDDYDRLGTSSSYTLDGLGLPGQTKAPGYHDQVMTPDKDIKKGDSVYAVVVRYSTGDSFGFDEGSGFDLVGAFLDEATAEKLAFLVRLHYSIYEKEHTAKEKMRLLDEFRQHGGLEDKDGLHEFYFIMVLPSGETFPAQVAWTGYFERLDLVTVEKINPA